MAQFRTVVVKGPIEEQTVDAIVNSCGEEFDLSQGALSSSILEAAGYAIQEELLSKKSSDLLYGQVTTTKGHDLFCRFVFHGVLKEWNDGDAKELLRKFIRDCLLEANRRELSSIAIPAVGSGILGFPRDVVVDCLVKEAYQFKSSNPDTTVKEIRFVVHEKDQRTFEAFNAKLHQAKTPGENINKRRETAPSASPGCLPGRQYGITRLDPSDAEFKMVSKRVTDTKGTASVQSIVKIEKIENPTLRELYATYKHGMEKRNETMKKQVVNERTLWHGTVKETITKICNGGFNRSYCGKNATVYGKGVYFARDFSYSAQSQYSKPDATGTKYIFMCKVLTGTFTLGNDEVVEPEMHHGTDFPHDSTVDDPDDPSIFVIFKDAQAYPEYLVAFK